MVNLSSFLGGAAGGASVNIVIRAVDQFSKGFKNAESGLQRLGKASQVAAIGVTAVFAVMAKQAASFEQTTISFNTMLGSAVKAEKTLKELTEFAKKTPFTLPGVEKASKMLLAFGFEADDLIPTLKSVGDVASGLGLGEEGLSRLILNLGQVKAQAKLTGRELRDFAIAGVPLLDELSRNLEVSTKEIQELVSKGEIGFDDVTEAFRTMSSEGGRFFDLMDKQSRTTEGRISNFKDSISVLAREMGQTLLPAINEVVGSLTTMINKFNELPEETRKKIGKGAVIGGLGIIGAGITAKAIELVRGSTPATPMFVKEVGIGRFAKAGGGAAAAGGIGVGGTLIGAAAASTILAFVLKSIGDAAAAEMNAGQPIIGPFTEEDVQTALSGPLKGQGTTVPKKITEFNIDLNKVLQANNEQKEEEIYLTEEKLFTTNELFDAEVKNQQAMADLKESFEEGVIGIDDYLKETIRLEDQLNNARQATQDLGEEQLKFIENAAASIVALRALEDDGDLGLSRAEFQRRVAGKKVRILTGPQAGESNFNDFISRPGEPISSFSPDDTIIGVKSGASLGGGMVINIENMAGLDADEIASALNDKLRGLVKV